MQISFGMNIDNAMKNTESSKAMDFKQIYKDSGVRTEMKREGNTHIYGASPRDVFRKLPKDFVDFKKGGKLIDLALKEVSYKSIIQLREIKKLIEISSCLKKRTNVMEMVRETKRTPNLKMLLESGIIPGTENIEYPDNREILKGLSNDEFKALTKGFQKYFNLGRLRVAFEEAVQKNLPKVH